MFGHRTTSDQHGVEISPPLPISPSVTTTELVHIRPARNREWRKWKKIRNAAKAALKNVARGQYTVLATGYTRGSKSGHCVYILCEWEEDAVPAKEAVGKVVRKAKLEEMFDVAVKAGDLWWWP